MYINCGLSLLVLSWALHGDNICYAPLGTHTQGSEPDPIHHVTFIPTNILVPAFVWTQVREGRDKTFASYPQQKPLFLLIYLMRKQQFINDLWAGDQMLPYVHKTRHQFCTFQQDTGTIWDWDTTRSDLLTAAALICPFGHLSSPSTWIRFKRVTHTSLCASRITHKEGSSRPANMTVQKSFLLFARKRSQEVEEDINKIRIRFF